MNSEITESVRELYLNPRFREAMHLAWEHRPRSRYLEKGLEVGLEEFLKDHLVGGFNWDWWPPRSEDLQEIRIHPWALENEAGGFWISYMLRSNVRNPGIGDSYTVLISGWAETKGIEALHQFSPELPERKHFSVRDWANWRIFWEGETYEIQDFGPIDVENLSRILREAIATTFHPLRKAVEHFAIKEES